MSFIKAPIAHSSNAGIQAKLRVCLQQSNYHVPDDVEKIGSRHFEDIRVKIISIKGGRGHGNGGFEHSQVANSRMPAIPFDLVRVNFYDLVKSQKNGTCQRASLFRTR